LKNGNAELKKIEAKHELKMKQEKEYKQYEQNYMFYYNKIQGLNNEIRGSRNANERSRLQGRVLDYQRDLEDEKMRHQNGVKRLQTAFEDEMKNLEMTDKFLNGFNINTFETMHNILAPEVNDRKNQKEILSDDLKRKEKELEEISSRKKKQQELLNNSILQQSEYKKNKG